jgi:hypothetical protein
MRSTRPANARTPDHGVARPRLGLYPAVSHDTRDDDGEDQRCPDNNTQHNVNCYVRGKVSDAVRPRPEVTGDPAAQLNGRGERDEYAPGPPVAQPPTGLPATLLPTVAPTATGLRTRRERMRWHARCLASFPEPGQGPATADHPAASGPAPAGILTPARPPRVRKLCLPQRLYTLARDAHHPKPDSIMVGE